MIPLALAAMLTGCAPTPRPELAWTFEARVTSGEVRVLPLIGLHDEPQVSFDTFVGRPVPWRSEYVRIARTEQLASMPEAIAVELPGAVNGVLGRAWDGQFRAGRWPVGAREAASHALVGDRPLDVTLAEIAGRVPAEATLFTWVLDLSGRPVAADEFPDCVIDTVCGPVLVDPRQEPYVVDVKVGVALVARDGEVVLRYTDDFQAILSGPEGHEQAARDVAQALAAEIGKVWAIDRALADGV